MAESTQTANRRLAKKTFHTLATTLKAHRCSAILAGTQLLDYLNIGLLMNSDQTPQEKCDKYHAFKWKNEPPRTCCSLGKFHFPIIRTDEPILFRTFFEGQDARAKIFKKYTRPLNNALALACLKTKTPAVPGGVYNPSVVIQGKVFIRMGPLQPDDVSPPIYSQLYVLDPDRAQNEEELCFNNMSLPLSTTGAEKEVIRELLRELQSTLATCNNYITDFKSAAEIIADDNSPSLQLVIDEQKRLHGEHPRRFNVGFKEISG